MKDTSLQLQFLDSDYRIRFTMSNLKQLQYTVCPKVIITLSFSVPFHSY